MCFFSRANESMAPFGSNGFEGRKFVLETLMKLHPLYLEKMYPLQEHQLLILKGLEGDHNIIFSRLPSDSRKPKGGLNDKHGHGFDKDAEARLPNLDAILPDELRLKTFVKLVLQNKFDADTIPDFRKHVCGQLDADTKVSKRKRSGSSGRCPTNQVLFGTYRSEFKTFKKTILNLPKDGSVSMEDKLKVFGELMERGLLRNIAVDVMSLKAVYNMSLDHIPESMRAHVPKESKLIDPNKKKKKKKRKKDPLSLALSDDDDDDEEEEDEEEEEEEEEEQVNEETQAEQQNTGGRDSPGNKENQQEDEDPTSTEGQASATAVSQKKSSSDEKKASSDKKNSASKKGAKKKKQGKQATTRQTRAGSK